MSEHTGYLTAEEVEAVQHLPRDTPYSITGVSLGQLSIARHYGGIRYGGKQYTYMREHDELVRDDVLKAVAKLRRKQAKAAAPVDTQAGLLLDGQP